MLNIFYYFHSITFVSQSLICLIDFISFYFGIHSICLWFLTVVAVEPFQVPLYYTSLGTSAFISMRIKPVRACRILNLSYTAKTYMLRPPFLWPSSVRCCTKDMLQNSQLIYKYKILSIKFVV